MRKEQWWFVWNKYSANLLCNMQNKMINRKEIHDK